MALSITYKDKNFNNNIRLCSPLLGGAGDRLIKIVFEMKKAYLAPQTEAIEVLADKVLMASPGAGYTLQWGGEGYNGEGQ